MAEMTIAEAAAALGLSVDTVRRRIRAGQLESRTDPRGRVVVQVEKPLPGDAEQAAPDPRQVELEQELARLREQLSVTLAERDWLRSRVESAERERERLQLLLGNSQQQFERLLPGPVEATGENAARPWWRLS
jgi:excisionase family DNA binding protein